MTDPSTPKLKGTLANGVSRRVLGKLALGAAVAPALRRGLGGAAPVAAITAGAYCPDAEERAFLALINDFRQRQGVGPLRLSRSLGAAAEHHSRDMAQRNYFSHQTRGGAGPDDRAVGHGYPSRYVAENIAAGYATARAVFAQWEASAGHRQNMLDGSFAAIGIGRARAKNARYGWYWTTDFGGAADAEPTCSGGRSGRRGRGGRRRGGRR